MPSTRVIRDFALGALLLLNLSAMAATRDTCEWRHPGLDPFMGDVPSAVDHYPDIPAVTRDRLKERMRRFAYDDIVAIAKHSITGKADYEPTIRAMHFGSGRICPEVSRRRWDADHVERALVYCEDGFCILVPSVCRNVSRIERRAPAAIAMAAPPEPAAEVPAPPMVLALALDLPVPAAEPVAATSDPGQAPWTPVWHTPPPWLIGGGLPERITPGTGLGPMVPFAPVVPPEVPPDMPPTWPVVPPVAAVPEPPGWALLGAGLLMATVARRRRRRQP